MSDTARPGNAATGLQHLQVWSLPGGGYVKLEYDVQARKQTVIIVSGEGQTELLETHFDESGNPKPIAKTAEIFGGAQSALSGDISGGRFVANPVRKMQWRPFHDLSGHILAFFGKDEHDRMHTYFVDSGSYFIDGQMVATAPITESRVSR